LSNILYQLEKGCYDMAQKEEKESWEKQEWMILKLRWCQVKKNML
jgi:hypothetical protein